MQSNATRKAKRKRQNKSIAIVSKALRVILEQNPNDSRKSAVVVEW